MVDLVYQSIHNAARPVLNIANEGIRTAAELISFENLTPEERSLSKRKEAGKIKLAKVDENARKEERAKAEQEKEQLRKKAEQEKEQMTKRAEQKEIETVLNLHQIGLSVELIAKALNITEEKVNQILAAHKK